MTYGGANAASNSETIRAPLIGPLVTGARLRVDDLVFARNPIPPLRVGAAAPDTKGHFISPPDFDPGWRDDSPGFSFAEAEPEDELALLHLDRSYLATAERAAYPGVHPAALALLPESARLEEIAARLEGIARILREQGSAAPLLSQGRDPLAVLITGYLVGYFEGSGSRERDVSG